MSFFRYVIKRIVLYIVVFFVAMSLTWLIPRLIGNPVATLLERLYGGEAIASSSGTINTHIQQELTYFEQAFALNQPLYIQYFLFLRGVFTGDLGVSLWLLGTPVSHIVYKALLADIILLMPTIIVGWLMGNYLGALAALNRKLDKLLIPLSYALTSIPYFILGLLLQWILAFKAGLFPVTIGPSVFQGILTEVTPSTILSFLHAWALPFLSLLVVSVGGWASGMRSLIIYELESNYSRFLDMLGFSKGRVSSYAFRYAMNPQISGLGITLGTLVVGAVAVEYIFDYPGLGYYLFTAITNNDPFLLEGCVLILVIMVVAANLIVDILYGVLDPRIRMGVAA